ncbi:MAG: hypothetical protein IJT65_02850 [Eubacterium sp.]|nr:hypothetical protein [Eubacterium sp.]
MRISRAISVALFSIFLFVSVVSPICANAAITPFDINNANKAAVGISAINEEKVTTSEPVFKNKLLVSKVTESASYNEEEEKEYIITTNSVKLFFTNVYMSISIQEFNVISNSWSEIKSVRNAADSVTVDNLLPGNYYYFRAISNNNVIGEYKFFTQPENIKFFNVANVDEKEAVLSWNNEKNYTVEIFKKKDDKEWKLLKKKRGTKYTDKKIENGSSYEYKIRYICENKYAKNFSDFNSTEAYIEDEINDIRKANGYIIIRQGDPKNRLIPYPVNGNGRTIGSSGCGVCASLMVLRNLTNYVPTLNEYTKQVISCGGRISGGTDMLKVAEMLRVNYGLEYKTTSDINELKKHLEKGYMATAHVGKSYIFTPSGGHFVTVAGIYKTKNKTEKAIILDPASSARRYSRTEAILAGLMCSDNGVSIAPFEALEKDAKSECFILFTPTKDKKKTKHQKLKDFKTINAPTTEKNKNKKDKKEQEKKDKKSKEKKKKKSASKSSTETTKKPAPSTTTEPTKEETTQPSVEETSENTNE